MWPEDESEGLYNSPDTTQALAWSEDNLIAAACGQGAMILNPADLKGPKAATANQIVDTSHLVMEEIPTNGDSNTLRQLLLVRQPAFIGSMKTTSAVVRQLAWSPGGCSAFGGCMLGVVTNDHRVRIYPRPQASAPNEWHPCKDLTNELRSFMERTTWVEADSREDDAEGEPLRLRGGGRSSSRNRTPALHTDSDNDNVPVRLKQAPLSTKKKVEAVEEEKEDSSTTSTEADVSDIEDDPEISGKTRSRRHAPRGKGSGRAAPSRTGRKQQTKPAAAKPAPKGRASKAAPTKAKPTKRERVKKEAAPVSQPSDAEMEAAASDGDLESGDEAAMVLAELAAGPSRATREGKAVGKRKAAAKGKLPAAKTHKRKRSSTPAAAKTALEKTAEEDTDEGKPSQRSSTPHSKQKHQSEYLPAEEYQVPFGFDSSVLRPASCVNKAEFMRSFVDAFLERWLRLRLEVPEEEIPQYTKGAHMRGPDVRVYERTRAEMTHVYGAEFQKHKLTEKWLNVECKRIIRTTVINPTMRFHSDASDEEIEVKGEDGSVTKRMATDTEKALRRLEQKRARDLESGNPSTEEEPAKPAPKRRRVISPKGPSYAARRAAAAAAAAHTFPTEKYERRIQLLQATCVGWSPFTAAREGAAAFSGQMCMVAVGTRAGKVWLWRYTPPPPTLFPAEDEESKRLELVGSVQTGASWVVSMKWAAEEVQGSLVLCAGHADGSAAVVAFDVKTLASPSLPEPLGSKLHTALATVLPKDPLGVTSMEVDCAGPGCLSLMVGKHVGGLAVWHGEGLDLSTSARADASLRRGSRTSLQEAHGTASVMGTAWLRGLGNGSDGCAASFAMDGEIKYWRCDAKKIELVASSRLKELKRDTLVNQPRANAAFGFCLSGNRILAAAVVETSNSKWRHLMETMTFKRMHRARIHLLHDVFLPDDLNDAVLFAAERLTKADASPVASLWDITAALHLAHRPEKSDDFVDPPKQVQSTDPAVCTAPVTQDLLARLERLGKRIMSTPADKRKTSERSLFQALDEQDWRGLQVANALRRLLFPLTLIVDKTTRKPVQQTDLSRQWEAQIRLNEFALLQRSTLEQLQAGPKAGSASDGLSLLLMADWVGLFSSQLQPELTPALAAAVYEEFAGRGGAERRPREGLPGNCVVEMKEAVHPVASARWACMKYEVGWGGQGGATADMGRCGATLRVVVDDSWHCRLCRRPYSQSALRQGLLAHNLCIFCGIRVGPLLGQEEAALGIQAIAQQQ